ncbi:DUF6950 family protein [Paradevosia shaoguanensis]|uniref:DUF6950 domain-containing protein n=1 Tax=Paradevosia shaoguanensis TaxID=1335043 RepID=A0AA41QQE0_9HYPH|nr:hypothetical protein [Paradevosia shaoguanensis]MCF1744614.1 hypothetical protein [Paradevosia shaoguanensis]MCI0129097.1 hypothetical protein [Paradevosia shaoguanensis]
MTAWTPPTIPARLPGWELAYVATIERQAQEPFAWGQADCLRSAAELCLAMTGVDPMAGLPDYATADEADALLASLGFSDLKQALQSVFRRIPKAHARRGDVGLVESVLEDRRILSTVIIMGEISIGKAVTGGAIHVPTSSLLAAFAVGER